MGKQYYCDYCNKSFADNATNRKNHLKGVTHQKMKRIHYAACRDAATIIAEESAKQPCMRYLEKGECHYGDGCIFSHLTLDRRMQLEKQISESKAKKRVSRVKEASVDEWLAKRSKRLDKKGNKESEVVPDRSIEEHVLPDIFVNIPNLPISLLPPPPEAFLHPNIQDWG